MIWQHVSLKVFQIIGEQYFINMLSVIHGGSTIQMHNEVCILCKLAAKLRSRRTAHLKICSTLHSTDSSQIIRLVERCCLSRWVLKWWGVSRLRVTWWWNSHRCRLTSDIFDAALRSHLCGFGSFRRCYCKPDVSWVEASCPASPPRLISKSTGSR